MKLVCAVLLVAAPAVAQVREIPVAFDAAGRVMVVTRTIADSVKLAPPGWPVSGNFSEARLHRQEGAGYIVIVTRPDGAMERFSISLEQVEAIRARFTEAPAQLPPVQPPPAVSPPVPSDSGVPP